MKNKQLIVKSRTISEHITEEDIQEAFNILTDKIEVAVTESSDIVVVTDEHIDRAGFYIKHFKLLTKGLEEIRKQLVNPKNQIVKQINQAFTDIKALYHTEEKRLIDQVEDVVRKRREAENLQAMEEQRELDDNIIKEAEIFNDESILDETQTVQIRKQKVSDKTEHIKTVRRKTWKVIDDEKIPRKYLMLNERLVTEERSKYDFENKDKSPIKSTIEGIEFTFEEKVSA